MKKKVYFSGSISGGRADAELYSRIIAHIKKTDRVLTEHIGDVHYTTANRTLKDEQATYEQDTEWLRECDLVIAECTQPSLGVGYEMAYAEQLGKPTYVFYRPSRSHLSAMISGDPFFRVLAYDTEEEIEREIDKILRGDTAPRTSSPPT
jgi:hypothetical protein